MGLLAKLKAIVKSSAAAKVVITVVLITALGGGAVGLAYAYGSFGAEAALGIAVAKTFSGQSSAEKDLSQIREFFSDLKEQGTDLSLEVAVAGTPFVSAKAYVRQEQLQISAPELFESVLVVNGNEFSVEENVKEVHTEQLLEIITSAYKRNLADTKLKRTGRESIREQGQIQNCRVYEARMDAAGVTGFLNEILTEIKAYAKKQGVNEAILKSYITSWEEAVYQLDVHMQGIVVWKFYVCEGRLVRLTAAWNMNMEEKTGNGTSPGSMELVLAAEGNPLEHIRFALNTPIHCDDNLENVPQSVKLHYEVNAEHTNETYSVQHHVKNAGANTNVTFCYKKADNTCTLEVAAKEQKITAKASLQVLGTETASLPGRQQNIFQMTEEELLALKKEVATNFTRLLFRMLGGFKSKNK